MPRKMQRARTAVLLLTGLLAPAVLVGTLCFGSAQAASKVAQPEPVPFTAAYYSGVNERFGVGLNNAMPVEVDGSWRRAVITDYDVAALHVGWYSDWLTKPQPLRPGGIRYAQMVLVRDSIYPTNTLQISETVAANPGSLWIVGNEPEGKYNQGNRTPAEYAAIYHDVYGLIKGLDLTAWVAIGGVIEPTPLRLQWLEMVLDEYQTRYGQPMPVDVWNIHVQILQERPAPDWGAEIPAGLSETQGRLYTLQDNADPQVFCQLVTEFRQWMRDRGFQNKPLIISEYGVLMPSTYVVEDGDEAHGDQQVIDFMRGTLEFLVHAQDAELGYPDDDHRLVQQWLWYSLNDQPYDPATGRGFNGSLYSYRDPKLLTKFGEAFRNYMHALLGYPRVMLPLVTRHAASH